MRNEASASKVARVCMASRAPRRRAPARRPTRPPSPPQRLAARPTPLRTEERAHGRATLAFTAREEAIGHHHQMFTPRGSMISRAMSITGMHRHSHHQKQKKFNLVHRGDEVEFEFVVTLDAFKMWFESDADMAR